MKKNFLLTAVSIGSRLLTGMLLFVLLARVWGPELFGTFSFAFSASIFLTLIIDFGFSGLLLREIGADDKRAAQIVNEALSAKILLSIAFMFAALIWILLMMNVAHPALSLPLLVATMLGSYAEFFIAPLRGMGRYDRETLLVIVSNILHFTLCSSIACAGGSPQNVATMFVISRACFLIGAFLMAQKTIPGFSLHAPALDTAVQSLRKAFPYGLDGALTTGYGQLDVIAIQLIFGPQVVGIYSAGQKLAQGAAMLAPVVGNVMIPSLARTTTDTTGGWRRKARATAFIMTGLGLLLGLPLVTFSEVIVRHVYGSSYVDLQKLLPFFGLLIFTRYCAASFGILLTSVGFQSKRIPAQLSALLLFGTGSVLIWLFSLSPVFVVISHCLAAMVMAAMMYRTIQASQWNINVSPNS